MRTGERWGGEYALTRDRETGARVHRLTGHPSINHSFFFLNPSFRPGHPGQVGFVTHRGGRPQVCLFDEAAREAVCLTDREAVQPFSPAFGPDGAALYYTTRLGEIWERRLTDGAERRLAVLADAGVGECSLSADGRRLVTAFKRGARHGVYGVDIATGEGRVIHEGDLKIIHPQFQPGDPERIVYAGDPAPRLWTVRFDGTDHHCLHANTPREFFVHESFLGAGDDLIFAIWPHRLCRMNIHTRRIETIVALNAWHMASDRAGSRIVSDTNHPDRGLVLIDPATGAWRVLCRPDASGQGSQWRQAVPAGPEVWAAIRGAEGQSLSWMEMQVDTVYGPQWTHPHPAFDETGTRVVFTSDRDGHPQVYVVEVEA